MNGVPVRYIPDDLKVGRRSGKRTIDLSLLEQKWNGVHLVDSGDVLAIYIGGILGKRDENPQVQMPQNTELQPAAGFPVTVREDGTISLPMIRPLNVRGLTAHQTEDLIREAYTNHADGRELLKPGEERILVSLLRPRRTNVMVVRQDSRTEPISNSAVGQLNLGTVKRGTGKLVSLPAYHNDVLNALVATDGLPGLDAENAVYIIRRQPHLPKSLSASLVDPAGMIRQSKDKAKPIIRGQNSDISNDRPDFSGSNPFADPSGSYRQSWPRFNGPDAQREWQQSAAVERQQAPMPQNQFDPANRRNSYGDDFGQNQFATGMEANPWRPDEQSARQPVRVRRGQGPNNVAPTSYPVPTEDYPPSNGPVVNNPAVNPYEGIPAGQSTRPNPYNGAPEGQPHLGQPLGLASPPSGPIPSGPTPPGSRPNWTPPTPNRNQAYPPPASGGPGYSLPDVPSTSDNRPLPPGFGPGQSDNPRLPPNFEMPQDIAGFGFNGGSFNPSTISSGIVDGQRIIRIPIRLGPDEQIDFKPEDVILYEGDIVFIESRDTEVFFTGGLLGGGQFTLPRDQDLNVLEALSIATSRQGGSGAARQIGGVSALNNDVTISPSNVIVIRKLPEGGEVPIKIDLYEARNDLAERLIIQPGDYIYLQYTPLEAIGAFVDRHLLEGALFGLMAQQFNTTRSN